MRIAMESRTDVRATMARGALVLGGLLVAMEWTARPDGVRAAPDLPALVMPAPRPAVAARAGTPVPSPEAVPVPAGMDPLLRALVDIESGGDPMQVGASGERGLLQIKRGAWRDMTRRHLGFPLPYDFAFDPAWNLRVGQAYLDWIRDYLDGFRAEWQAEEEALMLASYNAGPERVRQAGFRIEALPAHTQDYVRRALALRGEYRRGTPPLTLAAR